jgi:septal ring factor EnvC (AmiA/AmiB activator)
MRRPSRKPCRPSPIRARPNKLVFRAALIALLLPALALAAPVASKRSELKDLQGRIQALQKEVGQAEETRADAAEELRETERAISDANRRLRDLASERGEVQTSLNALNNQSQRLGERIAGQQSQLADLLYRQYRAGESDALRHLLSGNDPNQLSRDTHYLALLSRAKADLIRVLGETLQEKQRLAELARAKNAELAEIEKRQQGERAELLAQQKKRQSVLARIADKIKSQRREIDKLKRDERRLAKLIEGLNRIVARPKRPARSQALAPALRNEQTPDASASGAFAQLKGRLRLPARGELANRFGTPRPEGGTNWKGLFIRAAAGGEVKTIAPGRVVFADWLRGFGNLMVLDHGDGYLSVYGNNETLYKEVGQAVQGGETIAAVGNSGGNPETGLYFELRHLGQPLDPLKWVSLK